MLRHIALATLVLACALPLLNPTPAAAVDTWTTLSPTGSPTQRHEAAFVELNGRFYLMGGRRVNPVDVYDPAANTWTANDDSPIELHHFQAVSFRGLIYLTGAMTGGYPGEPPIDNILIYNPASDTWFEGPEFPAARRRGGAGSAVYQDKIYVVGGQLSGHVSGTNGWVDEYDPETGIWTPQPSDMPNPRDHIQVSVVGDKLYAAGGRASTQAGSVFGGTVQAVDMYDFNTGNWTTLANNIPTERAGAPAVGFNGSVYVMGGESTSQTPAHSETEAMDVDTDLWATMAPLNQGRHGTQGIVYDGQIYVASGSGNRGGGPELTSAECYSLDGPCVTPAAPTYQTLVWEIPTGLPKHRSAAAKGPANEVVTLMLINADTDTDIGPLMDGSTLNLDTLPTDNLNVRADCNPTIVGSVVFDLNGVASYAVETNPPYALAGDSSGNFNAWTPPLGALTITATPYTAAGGGGSPGIPLSVSLTVLGPVDPMVDFGSVPVGGSKSQFVGLTHPGTGGEPDINVTHAQIIGSDMDVFSVTFTPVTLSPGETVTIDVSFEPTAEVTYGTGDAQYGSLSSAALAVNYDSGVGAFTVPLTGTGVDPTPAPQVAGTNIFLRASPNPFATTQVGFRLANESMVDVAVFNLRGERVRQLHRGALPAGPHAFAWGGHDDRGRSVPSGVYIARVESAEGVSTLKLSLVR